MTKLNPETYSSKSSDNNNPGAGRVIGPVTGAATLGAAVGTIIVWLGTLWGLEVPQPVEGAIIVILTALGGWIVKPGAGKRRE